jgi:hypothetical protein
MVMRGVIHESPTPEVKPSYNDVTWSFDPRQPAGADSDPLRAAFRRAGPSCYGSSSTW